MQGVHSMCMHACLCKACLVLLLGYIASIVWTSAVHQRYGTSMHKLGSLILCGLTLDNFISTTISTTKNIIYGLYYIYRSD
jgi:hypothetical protein